METNPYEYDRIPPRTTEQNQLYQNKQFLQPQNQNLTQRGVGQKPGTQVKMPKVRALALANTLKRTLAVASIIGFGMFGGLVAMHQVSTTTTTTQSTQSTSGSSNTSSNSSTSSQNSNNFLNQQGGNTSGTSSTSSNNTTSTPVTGTTTS